jgi:hypothetical protein
LAPALAKAERQKPLNVGKKLSLTTAIAGGRVSRGFEIEHFKQIA